MDYVNPQNIGNSTWGVPKIGISPNSPTSSLVGGFNPTRLKNDGVNVSWDDDIPYIWKVIKLMFTTTNQFMMIADKTCPTCLGSMLACGVRSGGKRCGDGKRLKYMICQKLLTGPWTSIQLLRLPLNPPYR
jgi:hypothetical protein